MKIKNFIIILAYISFLQCEMFQSRSPKPPDLKGRIVTNSMQDLIVSEFLKTEIVVENPREYRLDELIDVHELIFLETNDSSMIGQIDKVIPHKDRIFVLDMHIAQSVFIFDRDGKFIQKISKSFRNSYLRDMELDTLKQQLVVYDRNNGMLLRYNFNGEFVETQNVGLRFSNFKILPDGNFVLFPNNTPNDFNRAIASHGLLIGNPNGNILFRGFPNSDFLKNMNFTGQFYIFSCCQNDLHICPRLSNSFYKIDHQNGKLDLIYRFHLPNGSMDEYELLDPSDFRHSASQHGLYYSLGDYCMMTDSVVFFKYITPRMTTQTLWYHRRTGNQHSVLRIFSSANRIFPPVPLEIENSRFVSVYHADMIASNKSVFVDLLSDDKSRYEDISKKIDTINESDNPTLIIYSIKW